MNDECTLTDEELIKKYEKLALDLATEGYKVYQMSIPPQPNEDSDYLMMEILERFKKKLKGNHGKI